MSAASILSARDGRKLCLAAALAAMLCTIATAFAVNFPALTGRVVDQANIIQADTRAAIEQKLADLETKSGIQLVVATVNSLEGQEVEPYANELFRKWGLGEKKKNNGVLLLVAPNERRVRIEVGYGLEGTLTDALSKVIITNAMTPRFKAGNFSEGISRGVDDIITVLTTDASEWQKRPSLRLDYQQPVDSTSWILLAVLFDVLLLPHRVADLSLAVFQCRAECSCQFRLERRWLFWAAVTLAAAIPAGAVFREAGVRQAAAALPGAGDDDFKRRPRTHHEGHSVGRREDLRRDRLRACAGILACNGFSDICRSGRCACDALAARGLHRNACPANPVRAGRRICRSSVGALYPGRAGGLMPRRARRAIAYRVAMEQFINRGIARNIDRCGILIFVSLAERYARIIADDEIAKRVPQSRWQTAVDALIAHAREDRVADGFIVAIELCGNELAQHFPRTDDNRGKLPDRLYVI